MKNFKNALQVLAREIKKSEEKDKKKEGFPGDKPSVTHHVVEINGKPLKYKATAGYMKIKDKDQKLKARNFYISYEKEDVKDKSTRPVTFAFNGGPGAASAWVHFGAMGPKRISTNDTGEILPPPYKYDDNKETWLDFTDLVFMDPVGTGFSCPGKDEDPKQFYGVEEDLQAGGDFIRQYISTNKRWLSPKYITGESYGTFRAAGLAHYLQTKHAMDFNGVILISSVLNFLIFDFATGNDLPFILFLPAYTATAFYHKKLKSPLLENLESTLKEAEDWAINKYSVALLKGDSLSSSEKTEIIDKLSYYTGISKGYIDDCNLRVSRDRFMKQLLHNEREVVGPYDARLKAVDIDPAGERAITDPSFFNIYGSCIATLNHFIGTELKYENELPYRPLSRDVNELWNWGSGINNSMGYIDITRKLTESMSYNKYLKVFFANGYYDLCTPYYLNKYTMEHLALAPSLRKNVVFKCYEGGHMMYVHKQSRIQLRDDLKAFIKEDSG